MKKVRIYTTTYCGYCTRAKSLLKELAIPYEEINVEGDDEKRDWLVEVTGRTTVPQIFFGEQSIGGYTDLAALHKQGKVMELLSAPA